uniref:Major sperm protein n=1 Tax=Loa loa TaxID=7209 RepID=A0A1I7VBJ2_LOALO
MRIKDDRQPLLYDRVISTKFLPVTDIPNTARVKLVLYNVSERPIKYKLKCEMKTLITAEPQASGIIPAHGVGSCLLIWRRAPEISNWKDLKTTSLVMITEFEGRISSSAMCSSTKPPEEYVTFKSSLDSVLPRTPNPESKVTAPVTGLQCSPSTSEIKSKNVMAVNKRDLSTNASEHSAGFYIEAKGAIIIALIIVIIILCIQELLRIKSEPE